VVVLFPLAAMHSKMGLFIRPLALTMFIMTLVSLFVSFTLTPMLCALLLRRDSNSGRGPIAWMERGWNRGFDRIIAGYRYSLFFLQRRRWAAALLLLAIFGLFVHSLSMAGKLGMSFFPETDKGEIYVKVEYPTSFSLAHTVDKIAGLEARLTGLPELQHMLSMVGKVEGLIGKSSEGVYLAQIILKFSERTARAITIDKLLADVRGRLQGEPGCIIIVQQPSMIGGQESPVQLEIAGDDLQILNRLALEISARTAALPGVTDTDTSVRTGKPEIRLLPLRPALAELGVPALAVGSSLRGNLAGLDAGVFKQNARNYDIVVKLREEEGRKQVVDFAFQGPAGHPLLLENLATMEQHLAPTQITRKNKRRLSLVYANLDRSLPLGNAVKQVSAQIKAVGLPPGYDYNFAGQYDAMAEANAGFSEAMLLSVLLVVLCLAAIMESFRQPLLILITLPLALTGTIWALAVTGESFGIFVIMSIVMMIGIVVNNAILIMDQFNMHVAEGYAAHLAMISAACERFRPIIMITVAAVVGMLPLALSRGIGAELRNAVGIASFGGILISGLLTLVVLPVVYDFIAPRPSEKKKPDPISSDE
jgi:HAE1 family hydrophobic/amphiphilic exporter-1